MKSNHRLHLAEYRDQIQSRGELMVHNMAELINLDLAAQQTLDIYSARQTQKSMPI